MSPDGTEKPKKSGLTVTEAAEMLGVGKTTLYDAITHAATDDGQPAVAIPFGWTQLRIIRIGRRIIVPRPEVERVLCERAAL